MIALAGASRSALLGPAIVLSVGAAAAGAAFAPPAETALIVAGIVAGIATFVLAWQLDPAVPLSLGIVLLALSGNWGRLGLPAGFAPDRALIAIGVVSALMHRTAGDRGSRMRAGLPESLMFVAALWAIASAIAAGTLLSGAAAMADRFGLMAFVVVFVAPTVYASAQARRVLLWALCGLGAYLAVTALFEIVGPRALVLPSYIADPDYGIHFGRARGPFVEAATNGMALFTCGGAALVLVALEEDRRVRVAALAVSGFCALGLILTLQRTVWVGAIAAIVVVVARRAELRRLAPVVLPGVALAAILVLALLPGLAGRAAARQADMFSVWDRQNLSHAALAMVRSHPLTGVGWARFTDESSLYLWQQRDVPLRGEGRIAHNALLANAAEIGLPGAVLWGLALIALIAGVVGTALPPPAEPWRDLFLGMSVFLLALMMFTPMLQPWPLVAFAAVGGATLAQSVGARGLWRRRT